MLSRIASGLFDLGRAVELGLELALVALELVALALEPHIEHVALVGSAAEDELVVVLVVLVVAVVYDVFVCVYENTK